MALFWRACFIYSSDIVNIDSSCCFAMERDVDDLNFLPTRIIEKIPKITTSAPVLFIGACFVPFFNLS